MCSGHLRLDGNKLCVTMGWHLDHDMEKTARKEFFRYRCHALADAFGHLKGVRGIRLDDNGDWKPHPVVGRPSVGTCGVSLGYEWPNIPSPDWNDLKERFLEVFYPTQLYGQLMCNEIDGEDLKVTGTFNLPEKGQSDA